MINVLTYQVHSVGVWIERFFAQYHFLQDDAKTKGTWVI